MASWISYYFIQGVLRTILHNLSNAIIKYCLKIFAAQTFLNDFQKALHIGLILLPLKLVVKFSFTSMGAVLGEYWLMLGFFKSTQVYHRLRVLMVLSLCHFINNLSTTLPKELTASDCLFSRTTLFCHQLSKESIFEANQFTLKNMY